MRAPRPVSAVAGGTVVTPDRAIEEGVLAFEGDRIADVWTAPGAESPADAVDAGGRVVLPGLVDLHGDDLEGHLFPRTDDRIPAERALHRAERSALSAGITTKFHAVAFEDAPDERRTVDLAADLVDAVRAHDRERGALDHRVHARCEVSNADAVAAVRDLLGSDAPDLVSLMHHVPGDGQFEDIEQFRERYDGGRADRHPRTPTGRHLQVVDRRATTGAVAEVEDLLAAARSADVPVATHDDAAPADVDRHDGVAISEFPLALPAARRAAERGRAVVVGAPNLVRGASLWGNLDAREAVRAGVVDALASDFRPAALLESVFTPTGDSLVERTRRVTSAPAAAVGLTDRGRLEAGARADAVVVDPDPLPRVTNVVVGGREVYRAAAPAGGP